MGEGERAARTYFKHQFCKDFRKGVNDGGYAGCERNGYRKTERASPGKGPVRGWQPDSGREADVRGLPTRCKEQPAPELPQRSLQLLLGQEEQETRLQAERGLSQ